MLRDAILVEVGTPIVDAYNRLGRLVGVTPITTEAVKVGLERRIAELQDPRTAATAARIIMDMLYPYDQPPYRFWATATGRAVAYAIGYHRERCPYGQAAAILNVSRQRVYQLCDEGRLTRIDDASAVAATSVREELLTTGRRPDRR